LKSLKRLLRTYRSKSNRQKYHQLYWEFVKLKADYERIVPLVEKELERLSNGQQINKK